MTVPDRAPTAPPWETFEDRLFTLSPDNVSSVGAAFGRTRLRTFIILRWLAVAGQTATVLFVAFILDFNIPLAYCLAAISASAWLNVFLSLVFPPQQLATSRQATLQLVFDVFQLSCLIALTGGLSNPFLLLLIAPITVAAVNLKPPQVILLATLTLALAGAMSVLHLPLPWQGDAAYTLPPILQAGQFTALAVGLGFFAFSALRVSLDEAKLIQALDAAQVVVAREQRLSALGALSAMTAHELGTPLATIHLVASELAGQFDPDDPMREDAILLKQQAERCREILKRLAQEREAADVIHTQLPLNSLLREASAPYRTGTIKLKLELDPQDDATGPAPDVRRSPEVIQALGAFIENALSFANTEVRLIAQWSDDAIAVTVRDDGPGFSASVLPKLGEPYVSHREGNAKGGGDMGLGFFIAKTLVERTGGIVSTRNASPPATGAVVRCTWPRAALEMLDGL